MEGTAFRMTVITDHKYLEYLLPRYITDVRCAGLRILAGFDFKIINIPRPKELEARRTVKAFGVPPFKRGDSDDDLVNQPMTICFMPEHSVNEPIIISSAKLQLIPRVRLVI